MDWWNNDHVYRRRLNIATSHVGVNKQHPVMAILPESLIINGKVREDLEDIEVIHTKREEYKPNEYTRLPRAINELEDGTIQVIFLTQEDLDPLVELDDIYKVYYGDLELASDLDPRPEFFPPLDQWPIKVDHDAGPITYTRPGQHWSEGRSSIRGARATFMGYASQLRLISVTDVDQGVLEVQIDGSDWELIDLFSNTQQEEVIFEAVNLDPDVIHEVRLRVSGEQNPKSSSEQVNIARVEYARPVIVKDVGEEANDISIGWSSATGGG